jgi:hypothetical protein
MGGSSSKISIPTFDETKASVGFGDVQDYQNQVLQTFNQVTADASRSSTYQSVIIGGLVILVFYLGYVYLGPTITGWFGSKSTVMTLDKGLNIESASLQTSKGKNDVTQKVINKRTGNTLHMYVDKSISAEEGDELTIKYQYVGEKPASTTAAFGKLIDITPGGQSSSSSWWNSGKSMNQLPVAKDATKMTTVSAGSAPMSDGKEGSYGYQYWMYITDWNYRFGEDKGVVSRTDPTSSQIMNPNISLHPTDNTLKISVSVFPSEKTSKNEPAPAGHSGSTDDVFICEVPNIPLQTWVAVGVTVNSRNLDVYLNGNLVKSCLMTGVPKPAAGDIQLNAGGGFSGWMCSFYHYDKTLQPSDAQTFFASGVPCSVPGTTPPPSSTITFGFFDTKGKEESKYVF